MTAGSKNEIELFPCGSRSRSSVLVPRRAKAAARLMAVVVFPTPPFWLVIAIITFDPILPRPGFNPQSHRQIAGVADYVRPFFGLAFALFGAFFIRRDRIARCLSHCEIDIDRTVRAQGQRDCIRRS